MPTIHRESGFNFKINTDDHEPAHVHVWHQGNLLIINFEDTVSVRENYGFNRNETRRALEIVVRRQAEFQMRWREIHGQEN